MFNHLKTTWLNCQTNFELKRKNESLIIKNQVLLDTIDQLNFKVLELEKYYFELLDVQNELLAKLNNYQSFSSQSDTKSENPFIAKFASLSEEEKEQERKKILACHCPCPVTEDENNVVIRYPMFDESFSRIPTLEKNNIPWTEKMIIQGGRYQLFIQLDVTDERGGQNSGGLQQLELVQRPLMNGFQDPLNFNSLDERTWEIGLVRDGYCIPKGYRLKAVTDKDEDFEGNEVIATGDTQDIYLSLELAEGEGLKFEIYLEPDDYLASRIFWFY